MADLKIPIRCRYGTRVQYNAWLAASGQLLESELGYITDENIILLGTASGTPLEFISKTKVQELINLAIPISKQTIVANLSEDSSGNLLYKGASLGSGSGSNGGGGLI